jgi:hypothetical protein
VLLSVHIGEDVLIDYVDGKVVVKPDLPNSARYVLDVLIASRIDSVNPLEIFEFRIRHTDGALAVAPEAPAANVVVSTTVDEEGNILLTMADGSTMIAGKAEATQPEAETETTGFMFEPANFVSNLYYMAVGMVGIFIVIGLIVLATILLNRFFRDKAQKSE